MIINTLNMIYAIFSYLFLIHTSLTNYIKLIKIHKHNQRQPFDYFFFFFILSPFLTIFLFYTCEAIVSNNYFIPLSYFALVK